MNAAYCTDCGRDRCEGDVILSITPDPGWVAEFATRLAEGKTASCDTTEVRTPDGVRWETWATPVIGWAVVERHFGKEAGEGGHDHRIEPVLLDGGRYTLALSEYREDIQNGHHIRITRTPTTGVSRPDSRVNGPR